uniref:Uncharacterized protein n=1 Tax=Trichogramma kaykai TaxID=54128 RepID=A0ABD2WBV9_9HYME
MLESRGPNALSFSTYLGLADEPHTRIQSINMSVDFGFTEEERVIAKLHLTHALRLAIDNFEQDHYAVKNADGCDFILMFDYAANWLREQLPGGRFTGSAQHPRSTRVRRAGPPITPITY